MIRFWISWYEPDEEGDFRPRNWPLAHGVVAYWSTGVRLADNAHTLCAIVDAENEDAAKAAIAAQGWTGNEWRFCEAKKLGWRPPEDRFPRKEKK